MALSKKPDLFSQILIIQFYHSITNKKYTGGYIILNTKYYEGYKECLEDFKNLLNKNVKDNCFESITIDFELGLKKACNIIFPHTLIIGCYYHYKAALVRYLKKLKVFKGNKKPIMKELISILGLLPIYYKGNIEYINKTICNIENDKRFKNLKIFFDYFRKEWVPNFENNMLNYGLIPKCCSSNTSLENYNKFIKENLNYNKNVEWINLLYFLRNEEERITSTLINDKKYFIVDNKQNKNLYITKLKLDTISENNSLLNSNNISWIKWNLNSRRYDVFITLYLTTFEYYIKN